jgi:hypothetical protein
MKLDRYDHNCASEIVPADHEKEVRRAIKQAPALTKATKLRDHILNDLRRHYGWSNSVAICSGVKNTITAQKRQTALCVQTGNMGRFYADLLKLQYLFTERRISGGIYVIPTKELAKASGENIAHFDRFTRELTLFKKIVSIPLLVLSLPKH